MRHIFYLQDAKRIVKEKSEIARDGSFFPNFMRHVIKDNISKVSKVTI